MWVFGVEQPRGRDEEARRLPARRHRAEDDAARSCSLHGAGDEQIPLAIAEKCFAAVGSKDKTLKVFHREEGGFHHCQVDNVTIGTNFMWDWVADVLKPGT